MLGSENNLEAKSVRVHGGTHTRILNGPVSRHYSHPSSSHTTTLEVTNY